MRSTPGWAGARCSRPFGPYRPCSRPCFSYQGPGPGGTNRPESFSQSSVLRTAIILTRRRHGLSVRKGDHPSCGHKRIGLGAVALNGDLLAFFQRIFLPALLLHATRARSLEVPLTDLAPGIRHAELHDNMRIRPVDPRDLAAQLHWRVGVKFRVKGVMGPCGGGNCQSRKNDDSSKSLHVRTPVEWHFAVTTGSEADRFPIESAFWPLHRF